MLREEGGRDAQDTPESSLLEEHLDHFRFFQRCGVPVVAAIRGVCLGSALELALFCHRRVCGQGAVLGLPESTFGLLPGCGGVSRLTSLAGTGRSLELILSGETYSAEEAFRWNIVDLICEKDYVIREAERLIERINSGSTPL
jgi:enoyl-CoA hydratase